MLTKSLCDATRIIDFQNNERLEAQYIIYTIKNKSKQVAYYLSKEIIFDAYLQF